MDILIAGGAGFIGSHLTDRLLSEGHKVTVIDNLCSGLMKNIEHHLINPSFTFHRIDIRNKKHLNEITYFKTFDRIYNLACPASPVHYQRIPIETMLTCVQGTYNLLNLASDHKARFLQASTSEVYGDPEVHPQPEGYYGNVNSYGPRACYDEGKRAAEALIYDVKNLRKLDTRIVRIFNTYGPRMAVDDGRVVSNFIVQTLKGEAITMYGDGSQTRSFCYVDDLVEGLIKVMEGDYSDPVNLGNPNEFTMKELAREILAACKKSDGFMKYLPLPENDPRQRQPDIRLAKKLYDWEPKIQLNQGLKLTVDYFDLLLRKHKV